MEWKDLVPILISIFSLVIGFIIQHFAVINKLSERIKDLEVKIGLFWKIVEQEIPKILHSPHTPEIDVLLEKVMGGNITSDEAYELKCKLKGELDTETDKTRVISMILLMARLEQYNKRSCIK